MGLKDKMQAALERFNAGRQAKLTAKSEVAASQGKYKKAARLEMRSKKVALRDEKRDAIQTAKTTQKIGKALGGMSNYMPKNMKDNMKKERQQFGNSSVEKPVIPQRVTPPPAVDPIFQSDEMKKMKTDLNMYGSKERSKNR